MHKILFTDRADFAVAKKAGESGQIEMLLHQCGIVARLAKKVFSPTIATKQAAAVNGGPLQILPGARQQFVHILVRCGGIATLELNGLAHARQRPDGQYAGIRVATDQIANQKIPAMKRLQILVHHQADA